MTDREPSPREDITQVDGHPTRAELIDFKISEAFAEHFWKHGYSSYRPPRQRRKKSDDIPGMKRAIEELRAYSLLVEAKFKDITAEVCALRKEISNKD